MNFRLKLDIVVRNTKAFLEKVIYVHKGVSKSNKRRDREERR